MLATAEVFGGVCGHTVKITVNKGEGKGKDMELNLQIETDCSIWKNIANELPPVKPFNELFSPIHEGQIYKAAAKHLRHQGCPVLSGVFKAVEVAGGFALPKDAYIKISS